MVKRKKGIELNPSYSIVISNFCPFNLGCKGWNKTFNIYNFNFEILKKYDHLKIILK